MHRKREIYWIDQLCTLQTKDLISDFDLHLFVRFFSRHVYLIAMWRFVT